MPRVPNGWVTTPNGVFLVWGHWEVLRPTSVLRSLRVPSGWVVTHRWTRPSGGNQGGHRFRFSLLPVLELVKKKFIWNVHLERSEIFQRRLRIDGATVAIGLGARALQRLRYLFAATKAQSYLVFLVFLTEFSYQADDDGTAGVAQQVHHQQLQRFGRGSPRRNHHVLFIQQFIIVNSLIIIWVCSVFFFMKKNHVHQRVNVKVQPETL